MSASATTGRFIALEGGEGAGKSTQARMLADHLVDKGFEVILTREPGGTPGAEAIRELLLQPPGSGWGARAEALLFAAARSDHVERLIRPALAEGRWVICDRFVDSSRAYQGGAGGLGDAAIVELHETSSKGMRPDLSVLLEVDEDSVEQRLAARDGGESDAIGGRDITYHRKVAAAFRAIAEKDAGGFAIIDASSDPQAVHAAICSAVRPLMEG